MPKHLTAQSSRVHQRGLTGTSAFRSGRPTHVCNGDALGRTPLIVSGSSLGCRTSTACFPGYVNAGAAAGLAASRYGQPQPHYAPARELSRHSTSVPERYCYIAGAFIERLPARDCAPAPAVAMELQRKEYPAVLVSRRDAQCPTPTHAVCSKPLRPRRPSTSSMGA